MSRPLVVIHGASGHARVVADILRVRGEHAIAGFLDDVSPERWGTPFAGGTVLGGAEKKLPELRAAGVRLLIVALGDCAARLRLAAQARALGFELATAVHPSAVVAADVKIGAGTVVAAGAVLNPNARLGDCVIVNTSASVDHDTVLEDGVHVSPGARLGGTVTVGRGTWIGIGATVIDHIRIGAGSVVGAGAVVVHDLPDGVVAYGVPAKIARKVTDPSGSPHRP